MDIDELSNDFRSNFRISSQYGNDEYKLDKFFSNISSKIDDLIKNWNGKDILNFKICFRNLRSSITNV